MADLDKFVLEYQVDLKDSISRLETLQKKMEGVGKVHEKSAETGKKFASGVAGELGRIIPGVNEVTAAVGRLGASFGAAAVAVTALGIGIKAVLATKERLDVQRSLGMAIGVSGARVEEYERKFVSASGGRVSREMTEEQLRTFAGALSSAYSDPTRFSPMNRALRQFGVNVGKPGEAPTDINTALAQLGANLKGGGPERVAAASRLLGLNQDFIASLRDMGDAVGRVTQLTAEELQKRAEAEESNKKLTAELSKLKEQFTELELSLGMALIPTLTKVIKLVNESGKWADKAVSDTKKDIAENAQYGPYRWKYWRDVLTGKRKHVDPVVGQGGLQSAADFHNFFSDPLGLNKKTAERDAAEAEKAKANAKTVDTIMSGLDEANKAANSEADKMALNMALFGAAVQSFSSAVNSQQAWAAWAGEAGAKSGLGAASNDSSGARVSGGGAAGSTLGIRNNNPGNIRKGAFATSMGATGENKGFAVFPTMEAGENAMLALLQGKGYMAGGRNTIASILTKYAPPSENNTGAYIAAVSKATGIDPNAPLNQQQLVAVRNAMMVHESGWRGAKAGVVGESKLDMRKRDVQANVAEFLGVPIEDIQQGAKTKGDVEFALNQKEFGIKNKIAQTQARLEAAKGAGGVIPQSEIGKMQRELRDLTQGLKSVQRYRGEILGDAKEGGRDITVGRVDITVYETKDAKATGKEVYDKLTNAVSSVPYNYANGTKG